MGNTLNDKDKIDIVIFYLDGNDINWQKKKAKYSGISEGDMSITRFRDWENVQYLFRGIEKNAPWINKVHFVTCHQIPEWMNVNHPKLNIVNHEDYMDEAYLPTFNSCPLMMNVHKIKDLSEQFIIFNDDFFICDHLEPTDFYVDGKPCDMLMEYPIGCSGHNEVFSHILINNYNMIGKYFSRKHLKTTLRNKLLSPKYGFYFFYNLLMYFMPFPNFFGALTPHFASPYLKSSFEEVWDLEFERLDAASRNRFRNTSDYNEYLMRIYNLMKGNFVPSNRFKLGKAYFIKDNDESVYSAIRDKKHKLICLNDECSAEVYEYAKEKIKEAFESIYPEKSSFEI